LQQKLRCELLSPAGSYNKFKTAIHYGADAVYLGGGNFGLRAFSDNFTNDDLKKVIDEAHALNKKVYITVNIYAFNDDLEGIKDYLIYLDSIKVDAVIISDLGVLSLAKKFTNLEIHISTQANTTNYLACETYKDLGADRIVLARE
jgi:putative protease